MQTEGILQIQLTIAAPPEKVFSALTDSAAVESWFAEHADISLADKRYDFWGRFTPEAPDREAGRHAVLEVEPNKRLKFSWHIFNQDTIVEMLLVPKDGGTVLVLMHHGGRVGSHETRGYGLEDCWFLALENLRRYIDGKPADARVDFSASMLGDIHHETLVDAPPEKVFAVLIQPDQINRWIASNAKVDPKEGGSIDLGWTGVPAMKILTLNENEKLAGEWPEQHGMTIVTWTLEESGGKTRLTFVHSGFAADHPNGGIKAGWRNFLNWIRSIAEYGDHWQPPVVVLAEEMYPYYPASVSRAQADLVRIDLP